MVRSPFLLRLERGILLMNQTINTKMVKHFQKFGAYYLMLIIPMSILLLFKYVPMYGAQIAFREFRITRSIKDSPWVGLKYFKKFFSYYNFTAIIRNTLIINLYSLLTFPLAPLFALCLNHFPSRRYTKVVQNISYLPHFISTVVLCSMVIQFTNARTGLINQFLGLLDVPSVNYMAKKEYFYSIYVWSGVWQSLGYNAILYIASLSSVSPELHEAAIIDGANILKRIWHVDIPGILPTICIMLILQCGRLLSMGYEKILLLQNPLNTVVSEVISSYSYNVSISSGTPQYSYAAAIDLFTAVINLIMLCLVNNIVKKTNQTSLW